MARIKLVVEYDGTDFVGWQVQPNGRTVQATIEEALEELTGAPTPVMASGRTDAGVHAAGQVVAFDVERALPMKAYERGLSSLLPDDVAVVSATVAPDEFDPRRWSRGKRYRYRIDNRPYRFPLTRRTAWSLFHPLDVPAMRAALAPLLGRHDFSAFRAADCQAKSAERELFTAGIEEEVQSQLALVFEGTAFLKHMVRNLVGSAVEVGRGRQAPEWLAEVLASKDRTQAGPTAPAHGLTLEQVFYSEPLAPRGQG